MSLTILTLEALDDLADGISPGPWSLNDRLEYVDADGDPLLTDNGAVIYQSDENLFLAAPAVLATARALYAERDDDDRWEREATAVLADIADAIGPAAVLGESHGATIRRLVAERAGANPITDALREKWPDHVGTDAELLRDLLIRVSGRDTGRPRWSNVCELTPHGSGYSSRICRAVGVDPDEVMPCPDGEDEP